MGNLIYIGNKLEKHGASPSSVDILGKLLTQNKFKVHTSSDKRNKILRLFEMQWVIIKNRKKTNFVLIDTYSTKNFWFAYISGKLCQILKLKYIPILRGGNLPERIRNNERLAKDLFEKAYVNVVPSNYLFKHLKTVGIFNLKFIPNSIPLKNYVYKNRDELQPKLLWVRAFDEIYNPMLAMKTLQLLLKDYPSAELCMVGPDKDGSLSAAKKYAQKHSLPVTFTGKLKKKEWISLSADYDFFINSSDIDNTPISVIEAMALGLPVVSTNVGGIPYLIEEGRTGLLVNPNDPEAMAVKIISLLEDPEKAKRMAENGREKIKEFDWELIKEEWNKVLT